MMCGFELFNLYILVDNESKKKIVEMEMQNFKQSSSSIKLWE